MNLKEFEKLKQLWNYKTGGGSLTSLQSKNLRFLYMKAELSIDPVIVYWVKHTKYDFNDPLKSYWGI